MWPRRSPTTSSAWSRCIVVSVLSVLRAVQYSQDSHTSLFNLIGYDVRQSGNDQFPRAGQFARPTEAWEAAEYFNASAQAAHYSFGGIGIMAADVGRDPA